jgi:transposase
MSRLRRPGRPPSRGSRQTRCTAPPRSGGSAAIAAVALRRARSLALKGRGHDLVRAKLALAAIRRLHALTAEIKATEADIAQALELRPHKHLMATPGVGPLVEAKIFGDTHDIRHFRSAAGVNPTNDAQTSPRDMQAVTPPKHLQAPLSSSSDGFR